MDNDYEKYFGKIYNFKNNEQYTLPNRAFESPKWYVPNLQEKKNELNSVKSRLGKYNLKVWSKHTASRDPSGFIMKKLNEIVQPELLTQAWCKFYEILSRFPVVSQEAIYKGTFTSVHLCEAPGAFVCALNNYVRQTYPDLEWHWIANTLNPNYEGNELSQMITDDRFIRYTLKNWYFGLDLTGDITKFYNHDDFIRVFRESKVDLVTADGSVDCMQDPGEQERNVEFLHFCETLSALEILRTGGTFVLKIFTIFEDTTINLIYLLNCLFEKVSVFKPCTSKSGNSEVYVINTNFKGFETISNILHQLKLVYDRNIFPLNSMFFKSDLPQSFFDQINNCVDFYMKKQICTIMSNIHYFENKNKYENVRVYKIKTSIAQHYLALYNPMWIPNSKRIVQGISIGDNWRVHTLHIIKGFTCIPTEKLVKHVPVKHVLDIKVGKQIDRILNSKFIENENLQKMYILNIRKNALLYNLVEKHLKTNNIIINIKEFHMYLYYEFQRDFFCRVYNSLGNSSNIIFINIPFHTHFLVGLLFILFYAFEKVYLGRGVIILYKCRFETVNEVKDALSLIETGYSKLKNEYLTPNSNTFKKDIVQIVPPNYFDETSYPLVSLMWNYNNQNTHIMTPANTI